MRLLPRLLLALAALPPVRAQEPAPWVPATLPRHLDAADPAEVAWAAVRSVRADARAAVPALRRALARLRTDDTLEGRLARLCLLTALIDFDVRMPSEELLPHAVGFLRAPALLLAAKDPLQNLAYFEARFALDNDDYEWCACGNLLAQARAPRFAARCLQRLEVPLTITFVDVPHPPPGPH